MKEKNRRVPARISDFLGMREVIQVKKERRWMDLEMEGGGDLNWARERE